MFSAVANTCTSALSWCSAHRLWKKAATPALVRPVRLWLPALAPYRLANWVARRGGRGGGLAPAVEAVDQVLASVVVPEIDLFSLVVLDADAQAMDRGGAVGRRRRRVAELVADGYVDGLIDRVGVGVRAADR